MGTTQYNDVNINSIYNTFVISKLKDVLDLPYTIMYDLNFRL